MNKEILMNKESYAPEIAIAANQSVAEREYWLNKLGGSFTKSTFPTDFSPGKQSSRQIQQLTFELNGELFSRLLQISNGSDYRLQMILMAGMVILLHRYTGNDDIILGSPIPRQERKGEFINTILVMRNQTQPPMTFKELLLQVRTTVDEAIKNQNFPIETLLNLLELDSSDEDFPLFDVALSLENIQDKRYLDQVKPGVLFSFFRTDLMIEGMIEYSGTRYKEETLERISRHYSRLLHQAVFHIEKKISHLEILSEAERNQILFDFNSNRGPFSKDRSVHQWIERNARKIPQRPALGYAGQKVTYHELNRRANRLGRYLKEQGIDEDHLVGILLPRSPEMAESILAIWKAGGAYIPLDVDYPYQRIQYLLEDSGIRVLLTHSRCFPPELEKEYHRGSVKVVKLDVEDLTIHRRSDSNPDLDLDMNRLAYVIYTSGSTGKPKGVMIEHPGMMNHLQAKINDLSMTDKDIVAQNASHTFDVSVWQFFAALTLGGAAIIYANPLLMEPGVFIKQMIEDRITLLEVVPSYLAVMLDYLEQASDFPGSLRYLLVTGETVKPHLLKRWFDLDPGAKVINAYGPTEASDDITHHIITDPPHMEQIPIGKPILNLKIYILDEHMRLCPVGVRGEICVSGIGVGRGYLKDPQKTKHVFMEDPFAAKRGIRLYKTGDLGRWLADGTIEFFGRKDHQVKIRGFRIELEEIENRLAVHPDILQAVVTDKEAPGDKGDKYLCAYYLASRDIEDVELREYLSGSLPDYMVPAYLIPLGEFPVTANGKIHRQALPEPELTLAPDLPYLTKEVLDHWEDTGQSSSIPALSEKKQEVFINNIKERLTREQAILETHGANGADTGIKYYPLTYPQRMIYFTHRQYLETGCENLVYLITYPEILDRTLLEKAINNVIVRNNALRLRVLEIDHQGTVEPAQYVGDPKKYTVADVDLIRGPDDGRLRQWILRQNREPMEIIDNDLFYFAYLRFNNRKSGYYMKMLHCISDGTSAFLLTEEIDKVYRQLKAGTPVNEMPNPSYLDFIREERAYLLSTAVKEDMKFWHDYLLPLPEEIDLSTRPNGTGRIEGKAPVLPFTSRVRFLMHRYRDTWKTSLFKQILAALSIYISRVTGIDDFVIGTLNHNRATTTFKHTDGTFIAFLPIRIRVDNDKAFHRFVRQTGQQLNFLLKNHQKYPFGVLINELRENTGVDTSFFYNVNLIGHPDVPGTAYKIEHQFPGYEPTPLSIHINFSNRDIDGILELEWDHQVERFSDRDIHQMHQRLMKILEDALTDPEKRLGEIQLLSEKEKERILHEFNRKEVAFPQSNEVPPDLVPTGYYIVSPGGTLEPAGVAGELMIGSNQPPGNIPEDKWLPNPFGSGGYIYRTGEMAQWLSNGEIKSLGKIETQVSIKGRRIDVGEVEKYLLSHSSIREAVIIKRDKNGLKYLCAAVVGDKTLSAAQLKAYLSGKFPVQYIPTQYLRLEAMPRDPGGRVDRGKLAAIDIDLEMEAGYVKPVNEVEEKLVEVWQQVLGRDRIGTHEEFFLIGGDSIKAIQISSRMRSSGFKIDVKELFSNPSIKDLAPLVTKLEQLSDQSLVTGTLPLTPIQKDFFALSTIDRHHYNQSVMLFLKEGLDRETTTAIFSKIQEHHDILRLTVKQGGEDVVQTIRGLDHPLWVQEFDLKGKPDATVLMETRGNEIQASINLETGPLMKLGLFHLTDGDRLLIVVHHLAIDGVSWRILFEDLERLYHQYKNGEKMSLPYKTDSYKRWAEKLQEYAGSDSFEQEKEYWLNLERIPVPLIKKDYDEDNNWKRERKRLSFQLSREQTHLLLTKVNEPLGTEINDILLTALGLAVKKHFGLGKILVALEGHGREEFLEEVNISRTVGWFTSIYPVILDLGLHEAPDRQIKEIKEILRRVPNKGVGYGILKYLTEGKGKKNLTLERHPQISFNYMGRFDVEVEEMVFRIAKESPGNTRSLNREGEYELDVLGVTTGKQLDLSIEYNTRHYKSETMAAFLEHYERELTHLISYCSSLQERKLSPSDLTYKDLSISEIEEIESLLDLDS